jgi:hypothetical protein
MKVYDQTRDASVTSIDARITVLRAWIAKGVPWQVASDGKHIRDENGDLKPEYIPTGFGEFCNWSSRNHSPAVASELFIYAENKARITEFGTVHRNTLNQAHHRERKELAKQLMDSLAQCLAKQLEAANKSLIIENQKLEIEHLRLVVAAQETELKNARLNERTAITDSRQEKALRLRNELQLQRDASALTDKVAELTRQLAQIQSLKSAKRVPK